MNSQFKPFSAAKRGHQHSDGTVDALLDDFEGSWSADWDYFQEFAKNKALETDARCLVELTRADIDRRYSAGVDVELRRYFEVFPVLLSRGRYASEIAFEDYRARKSRGLRVPADRWSWIPGVHAADWFAAVEKSSDLERAPNSAASVSAEPVVGGTFGEFNLLALLGTGAFSRVFLATQSTLAGRYVALKIVRKSLDEPAHLARLQHTGIVPLYSIHRVGCYTALCMPYYGSATLADWLGEQTDASERNGQSLVTTVQAALEKLTSTDTLVDRADGRQSANGSLVEEANRIRVWNAVAAQPLQKLRGLDARNFLLWFARNIAAALAHAHERGIVHGDLKPANILLRNDGEPALIDFNLAQDNESNVSLCAGGTLPYMSPEQLRMLLGQRAEASTPSDIFSLGIILFEVIENRLPFPAPLSTAEVDLDAAIVARRSGVGITSPNATPGLRAIVSKCLAFHPADRYASASSLLEDLVCESSNLGLIHARESFVFSKFPKFVRRYPRAFSIAPIATLSLVGLLVMGIVARNWWLRAGTLHAATEVAAFEKSSTDLVPRLISERTQAEPVVSDVLSMVERLVGRHEGEFPKLSTLGWLSAEDRAQVEGELFDVCLVSAGIACETLSSADESAREKIQSLLAYCQKLESAKQPSPVLARLQRLVSAPGSEDVWEANLIDFSSLRPAERLLLARGDVLQERPRAALEHIASLSAFSSHKIPMFAYLHWLTAGDAQARIGQYEAALMSYEMAIASAPRAAAAYVHRARLRVDGKDYSNAELDYSAAIEIAPEAVDLYVNRALVRERTQNFHGALQDLDRALQLLPDSNRILLVRGRVNQQLGDAYAARQDFKQGMLTVPQRVDDWISRGLAQLPRFPDRALRDLNAAKELAPKSLEVLQNIAHVHSEHLKDVPAAISVLDEILDVDASRQSARAGRCVLYARAGRSKESLDDISVLTERTDRLEPATLYQIGCAYALMSADDETYRALAVRFVSRALGLGYGADLLQSDPDLDLIRGDAGFDALSTVATLNSELEKTK